MSTVRRGPLPTDHFTIVSNAWMRDAALPWEVRGLLAWLAGHAADHDITEDVIVAAGPAGVRAVRTMIKTLEEAGYLRRDRTPILTGGSTVDYVLLDPGDCRNGTLPRVPQRHPRADQGKQDSEEIKSAGQTVSPPRVPQQHPRSSPEDQEKNKETSSLSRASRSDRGTRIPEDFTPDEKMREWYAAEGLERAGLNGRLEHQKFMNYWLSKPGAAGRKTDWRRTWMNWMLSAAERLPARPVSAPPGSSLVPSSGMPSVSPHSTTNARVLQGLALAEKFRQMEENQ